MKGVILELLFGVLVFGSVCLSVCLSVCDLMLCSCVAIWLYIYV